MPVDMVTGIGRRPPSLPACERRRWCRSQSASREPPLFTMASVACLASRAGLWRPSAGLDTGRDSRSDVTTQLNPETLPTLDTLAEELQAPQGPWAGIPTFGHTVRSGTSVRSRMCAIWAPSGGFWRWWPAATVRCSTRRTSPRRSESPCRSGGRLAARSGDHGADHPGAALVENFGKRLVKSPKVYLGDPGLACYLLGIASQAELFWSGRHFWERCSGVS